jgi:DNA-binding transcriptional LysR family regulator
MQLTNIDLDALRTLVLAQDLGGFGRAATQLRRTPSAISLQMKRLQEEVGVPLLRRHGRKTELTEQGEIAVRYARRILELNDEMLDTLRGASLSGVVRIGFAQDFVETVLPQALSRFHQLYPLVRLEVKVDRNATLKSEIDSGALDLALTLGDLTLGDLTLGDLKKDDAADSAASQTRQTLGELPLCWIASPAFSLKENGPLPLVLFEHPCIFRTCALDALDRVGQPWRIAMTSPSVAGLWAAVGGGLGVTVRARTGAPQDLSFGELHLASPATGAPLPRLGAVPVTLHRSKSARAAYVRRLGEIVAQLTVESYQLRPSPVNRERITCCDERGSASAPAPLRVAT